MKPRAFPSINFLPLFFACSIWPQFFQLFFPVLGGPRAPSGERKTICDTVIINQGFAQLKKTRFCEHFGHPLGPLLGSFWAVLGTLGRSWAPLGVPKGTRSQKKEHEMEVWNLPGRPEESKGRPRRPKTSKMESQGSKMGAKIMKNHVSKSNTYIEKSDVKNRFRL